jgi:hypothetical protein
MHFFEAASVPCWTPSLGDLSFRRRNFFFGFFFFRVPSSAVHLSRTQEFERVLSRVGSSWAVSYKRAGTVAYSLQTFAIRYCAEYSMRNHYFVFDSLSGLIGMAPSNCECIHSLGTISILAISHYVHFWATLHGDPLAEIPTPITSPWNLLAKKVLRMHGELVDCKRLKC